MKKKKNIVIYILMLLVYMIVSFSFIVFKGQDVIMPISGIPLWMGNLIFCCVFSLYIYSELQDYDYNKSKKIVMKKRF